LNIFQIFETELNQRTRDFQQNYRIFLAIFQHFWGKEKLDNNLADLSRNFARTRPASAESENWGAQVAAPLRHTEAPPSPVAKVDRATADARVFFI
jgi:hypothetical protein